MSVRRNVIANYLGQGWGALMGVAFVPLYISVLGVGAYGLVGVFVVLQAWMTLLDLGLTPTLNREMARLRAGAHTAEFIRDLLRSLELLCSCLALVMILVVWLLAPWLAREWLQSSGLPSIEVVESIRIMGFVLASRWLEQLYRSALQGLHDQVWLNTMQAFLATVRWGGAYFVLEFFAPTILAFFLWQLGSSVLFVAILVYRVYFILPRPDRGARFDIASLQAVQGFAGGMFLSSILTFALTQSDKIILGKLLPLDQLGYYMLATTATGGLLQLVLPMNSAIYPRLIEQVTHCDEVGLVKTYHLACEWMSAIIIPPSLLLTFFADPLLILWTGDPHLTNIVKNLLAVLALGTLCNGLMNLPYMLQLAHGWTSLSVRINIAAVLLVLPATYWAVACYGFIGAALVWLGLNLCYLVVVAHIMHNKILPNSKWRWYRESVLAPLCIGSLVGIGLLYFLPEATTRVEALVIVIVATVGLFASIISVLPNVRQEILSWLFGKHSNLMDAL